MYTSYGVNDDDDDDATALRSHRRHAHSSKWIAALSHELCGASASCNERAHEQCHADNVGNLRGFSTTCWITAAAAAAGIEKDLTVRIFDDPRVLVTVECMQKPLAYNLRILCYTVW